MEPPPQQQQKKQKKVAPAKKRVTRMTKPVDYSNVVLALPALSEAELKKIELRAERKKRVATDENNAGGPSRTNKKREAATEPKDAPRTGRPCASGKKRVKTAENTASASSSYAPNISNGDDILEEHSSDVTKPNAVRNEKYIPNEEAGTVQLQNPANVEDILQEDPTVQRPNAIDNEQQIIEEQADVENQDVAVNQQHLQADIMHEQNIQNAIEENVPEDLAVFGDIFNFPLNNELIDLPKSEDILEDPTRVENEQNVINNQQHIPDQQAGVENEQNVINNQQHIPDQQAGIVHQQNPAENAIVEVEAEADPTVFGDIFDFPLNNQLMDLD